MKKSNATPTYRAMLRENGQTPVFKHWQEHLGEPTQENVDKWRDAVNASYGPRGEFAHISNAAGRRINFHTVTVFDIATGKPVAESKAPMFEVIDSYQL